MTTIATVTAKTYSAALQADGTCIVSGLKAADFVGFPNNGRSLDRQRALRNEVQAKLYDMVPVTQDDPTAGAVIRWEANL